MKAKGRYIRRVALIAQLIVLLVGFPSTAMSSSGNGRQVVEGRVLAPAGPVRVGDTITSACSVLDATVQWATRQDGVFTFAFRVRAETRGLPFVLTPKQPADLDIVFRGRNGSEFFGTVGPAEERGIVPIDAAAGYICVAAGGPTDFTYRAGSF